MSVAANLRRALGEFKSEGGSFAVEAALLAPVLVFFVMLTINFGVAYNTKLRLVTAAGAGMAYAQKNGASVTTAEDVASLVASITKVVQNSADFSVPPKVAVSFNNASDGSAADGYYCINGAPAVWSRADGASSQCGNNVTAGKFVTLTLSTDVNSIFPTDGIVGAFIPLQETIVARVQ